VITLQPELSVVVVVVLCNYHNQACETIIEKSIIEKDSRSRVLIIDSQNGYACTGSS